MFLFHLLCSRKDKWVPHEGLRLYPKNLMQLVLPKGLCISSVFSFSRTHPSLYLLSFIPKHTYTNMKVQVNNKEVETAASTLAQLATQLQLPENGVAIAVNNRMIPRPQWDGFGLQENDNLIVIKAACGG